MSEYTPETLRQVIEDLDDFMRGFHGSGHNIEKLLEHADAWEADIENAKTGWDLVRDYDKQIKAIRKRLEEAVWLLNHDDGDIGGVGRKEWLKRRDILYAALAQEKPEADDE
jgi:hypothetical protein